MTEAGLAIDIAQSEPVALTARFSCKPGELLAIVGPSGSGKSTLLRAIAGLGNPPSGTIRCNGELWLDSGAHVCLSAQRRRLGVVFQQYALFPHLNAIENVMEALTSLPKPERRQRAKAWLDSVHMDGLDHRRPAHLSGGQQQRVALARALAGDPRALLLDEPFAAVDKVTRQKLYLELALLRRELRAPTLLVTHDVEEAMMLADRLCVFSQGQVLQVDTVPTVIAQPASGQVARLVGHRNIFRAQVLSHEPASNRTLIEWRGLRLAARMQSAYPPETQVSWVIPRSKLLVFTPRQDEPGRENAFAGSVVEMLSLGDMVRLTVAVGDDALPPLHLSLPVHVVERRAIAIGAEIWMTFQADGIWLMPNDKYRERDGGTG